MLIPSCEKSCLPSSSQKKPRPGRSHQPASRALTTNQPSPPAASPCSVCSSGASGTIGPLEVGVRDRVAVRVVGRVAERTVDLRLQLLGEDVLEPVGLVVDILDVEPEGAREVELEQPVVADHLERDLLAGRGEPDAAIGHVLDESERREL